MNKPLNATCFLLSQFHLFNARTHNLSSINYSEYNFHVLSPQKRFPIKFRLYFCNLQCHYFYCLTHSFDLFALYSSLSVTILDFSSTLFITFISLVVPSLSPIAHPSHDDYLVLGCSSSLTQVFFDQCKVYLYGNHAASHSHSLHHHVSNPFMEDVCRPARFYQSFKRFSRIHVCFSPFCPQISLLNADLTRIDGSFTVQ